MKLFQIEISYDGNVLHFKNTYLDEQLRNKLSYRDGTVRIKSCAHPQIDFALTESMKIHEIRIFTRGSETSQDDLSFSVECSEKIADEVIGKILLALARCDLKLSTGKEEDKPSYLIYNGENFEMCTGRQLQIGMFLSGGKL